MKKDMLRFKKQMLFAGKNHEKVNQPSRSKLSRYEMNMVISQQATEK
jgi:hypothetical protein